MAPGPLESLEESIKRTIHSLYTLQSSTHGYLGPETQAALVVEITALARSLTQLHSLVQPPASQAPPLADAQLPPEVIEYVDAARNPDIYTREFVELVQRGNSYLKGKGEALSGLRDNLAAEMRKAWPEMEDEIAKIVPKDTRS